MHFNLILQPNLLSLSLSLSCTRTCTRTNTRTHTHTHTHAYHICLSVLACPLFDLHFSRPIIFTNQHRHGHIFVPRAGLRAFTIFAFDSAPGFRSCVPSASFCFFGIKLDSTFECKRTLTHTKHTKAQTQRGPESMSNKEPGNVWNFGREILCNIPAPFLSCLLSYDPLPPNSNPLLSRPLLTPHPFFVVASLLSLLDSFSDTPLTSSLPLRPRLQEDETIPANTYRDKHYFLRNGKLLRFWSAAWIPKRGSHHLITFFSWSVCSTCQGNCSWISTRGSSCVSGGFPSCVSRWRSCAKIRFHK